ncbi:MAG: hypothetical protein LBQ92_04435, partial [Propionibacteriaceae bacterium]|nr:hypothetical protein [Propionibacteriaceae bacterium]
AKTETTVVAKAGEVIDVTCSSSWSTKLSFGSTYTVLVTDLNCTSDKLAEPLSLGSVSCNLGYDCGTTGIAFSPTLKDGGKVSDAPAKSPGPADHETTVTPPATTETVWSAVKKATKTQSLKVK